METNGQDVEDWQMLKLLFAPLYLWLKNDGTVVMTGYEGGDISTV